MGSEGSGLFGDPCAAAFGGAAAAAGAREGCAAIQAARRANQ